MKKTTIASLIGATVAASMTMVSVPASANPFGAKALDNGYAQSDVIGDKGKEGKCGEAKCGAAKKGKKGKEGKCGEAKCGAAKKGKEGKCGAAKKDKEGKCGGKK
jgi:uncharacterized low-complexity protein